MSTVHQETAPKGDTRDDWETPDEFWRLLDLEFRFTLDVCATAESAKVFRYLGPDHKDPLSRDALDPDNYWSVPEGSAWWCNPPFSDIPSFVAKARGQASRGRRGVMLLPANRTDQPWWHELVLPSVAEGLCRIRWLRGRLKFKGAPSSAPFGCLLLIWGHED